VEIPTLIFTGSGKTYFMRFILTDMMMKGKCKWVNVLTGTRHDDEWDFLDPEFVIGNDRECRATYGITDQKVNVFEWYLENKLIPYCEQPGAEPGILIIDDPTGSCNFMRPMWDQVMTNFRHYCNGQFSILLASHYPFKIPRVIREAATHAALFSQQSKAANNALFEVFGQAAFGSYKEFLEYMKKFAVHSKRQLVWYAKNTKGNMAQFQPVVAPHDLPDLSKQGKRGKEEDDDGEPELKRQKTTSSKPPVQQPSQRKVSGSKRDSNTAH
jgi:hypothetical protein